MTNFDESSDRQLPITTAAGVAIQQGGIVQVGAFNSADVAELIGEASLSLHRILASRQST